MTQWKHDLLEPKGASILALAGLLLLTVLVAGGAIFRSSPVHAATIVVDSLADTTVDNDNDCTLPEAIENANSDSDTTAGDCDPGTGDDTITFSVAGSITLGLTLSVTDNDGLTINGGGTITVDGNNAVRVFTVDPGAGLTLDGLTVANGSSGTGAGIYTTGGLTLIDSVVVSNTASIDGGGIYNEGGSVTLVDSAVSDNAATGLGSEGGGIFNDADGTLTLMGSELTGNMASRAGGAVFNLNSLSATDTIFSSNTANAAPDGVGGGAVFNGESATLTFSETIVTDNQSDGSGGGIFNGGGVVSLTESSITGNSAGDDGGGIDNELAGEVTLVGSTVSGNTAVDNGGGIDNDFDVLTLTNSTVSGNSSGDDGGGIDNTGTLTLNGSSITGNTAGGSGGGIDNGLFQGTLTMTNSTVSDNSAVEDGGGIANEEDAEATIVESTISGNMAVGDNGGGVFNNAGEVSIIRSTLSGNNAGFGGGIRSNLGSLSVANSTISGNIASFGAGLYNGEENTTTLLNVTVTANNADAGGGGLYNPGDALGDVILVNTIVASQVAGADCAGSASFLSQGHNLDSDGTCNLIADGDIPSGNANLGPLADNGGPTLTHALLPGSDAIDTANDAVCSAEPVDGIDQRGVTRPQDGNDDGDAVCDIGAFELAFIGLTITKVCPSGSGEAVFNILVGGDASIFGCGTSLDYDDLPAGDITITETISGTDTDNFVTSIDCDNGEDASGSSLTFTLVLGEEVSCDVINIFIGDGLTDEELEGLLNRLALELQLEIEIKNILNNINQNANISDNTNENNNANENTQNQSNAQDTNVATGDVNVSSGSGAGTGTGTGTGSGTGTSTITPPNTGTGGIR